MGWAINSFLHRSQQGQQEPFGIIVRTNKQWRFLDLRTVTWALTFFQPSKDLVHIAKYPLTPRATNTRTQSKVNGGELLAFWWSCVYWINHGSTPNNPLSVKYCYALLALLLFQRSVTVFSFLPTVFLDNDFYSVLFFRTRISYLPPACCTFFWKELVLDATAKDSFYSLTLTFEKFKVYLLYSTHSFPCLLCVRTAHAQGKAEAAVGAAQKAQEESRMARVTAKQFSPSFQHPGNGGHTHSQRSQHTYIPICSTCPWSTNPAKQTYM